MGDVESLSWRNVSRYFYGAAPEWTLLLIGIVYVFETTSVMMQVSYALSCLAEAYLRMTPVHHHFELGGFSGKVSLG